MYLNSISSVSDNSNYNMPIFKAKFVKNARLVKSQNPGLTREKVDNFTSLVGWTLMCAGLIGGIIYGISETIKDKKQAANKIEITNDVQTPSSVIEYNDAINLE